MKRFVAVAVIAYTFAGAINAQDITPTVAALAEVFDNPTLGSSVSVKDVTIALSPNMTLRLAAGNAAPVLAGEEPIGIFFAGSGNFEYRSIDPLEATNVKFAVKKASDLTTAQSGPGIALKWRYLTTQDTARLLQRIDGGKDWMPFFDQYYWGTDMPKM
jgi:hypothetical protein